MSSVRLFGFRVLVERVKEKQGSILVPESAQILHQIARVVRVGDCKQPNGVQETSLVQEGDLVYFQTNLVLAESQHYEANSESYLNLHQGDLIAKLSTNIVHYDNFQPLGRWVLAEPFMRTEAKLIVLPSKLNSKEFVYFRVAKLGDRVKLPLVIGQEIMVNTARLCPVIIPKLDIATAETRHMDFAYIDRDYVLGCIAEEQQALAE